jgi:hypothetical protein
MVWRTPRCDGMPVAVSIGSASGHDCGNVLSSLQGLCCAVRRTRLGSKRSCVIVSVLASPLMHCDDTISGSCIYAALDMQGVTIGFRLSEASGPEGDSYGCRRCLVDSEPLALPAPPFASCRGQTPDLSRIFCAAAASPWLPQCPRARAGQVSESLIGVWATVWVQAPDPPRSGRRAAPAGKADEHEGHAPPGAPHVRLGSGCEAHVICVVKPASRACSPPGRLVWSADRAP